MAPVYAATIAADTATHTNRVNNPHTYFKQQQHNSSLSITDTALSSHTLSCLYNDNDNNNNVNDDDVFMEAETTWTNCIAPGEPGAMQFRPRENNPKKNLPHTHTQSSHISAASQTRMKRFASFGDGGRRTYDAQHVPAACRPSPFVNGLSGVSDNTSDDIISAADTSAGHCFEGTTASSPSSQTFSNSSNSGGAPMQAAAAAAAAAGGGFEYKKFAARVASHLQLMASPMKTDGFMNWSGDNDMLNCTTNDSKRKAECPVCSMPISSVSSDQHAHVSTCFLSAISPLERKKKLGENAMLNIQRVQDCIGALDLRTRLAVMESLYRLGKAHGGVERTPASATPVSMSVNAEKHDQCVLAMLFGSVHKTAHTHTPGFSLAEVFSVQPVRLEPFRMPDIDTLLLSERVDNAHERVACFQGEPTHTYLTMSAGGVKKRRYEAIESNASAVNTSRDSHR